MQAKMQLAPAFLYHLVIYKERAFTLSCFFPVCLLLPDTVHAQKACCTFLENSVALHIGGEKKIRIFLARLSLNGSP